MPNSLAFFSLIVWPLVALQLYLMRPAGVATMWTILAAQLLLPVGTFFKLEMIPIFDKTTIPNLCALVGCLIFAARPSPLRKWGIAEVLILLGVVGPLLTSMSNGDPISIGNTVLPAVGAYDGISALLLQFISLLPFFLGRRFLRNELDAQRLFETLTLAGLAYSLLLLFEIRFAPLLHLWVYGYSPSDFIQAMRGDGTFRPMVFMGHGLVAAFFAMTAAVASAALWRTGNRALKLAPAGVVTAYLSAVLVLCRSGAALLYGIVLVPLVKWTRPRIQMRIALVLVSIALLYPTLRYYDLFPTNTIVELSRSINEDRAGSLQFRFEQEKLLLDHASQRILFGWGRYGRSRIYAVDYRGVAGDISVTDGRWIITLGVFGIVGFVAEFGLLALSVFRAAKALKFAETFRDSAFLSALALIVGINMIELLPNSSLTPWTWLLAGSLLGRSEMILARSRKAIVKIQHSLAPQVSKI